MNCLEQLQDHRGGLIRLKTQLYWYGGVRGWDGCEGRICLLLDATASWKPCRSAATAAAARGVAAAAALSAAHLMIDGAPHWVWVAEADVEFL